MEIEKSLRAFGAVPFGHEALLPLLTEYRRPNDKIADLVDRGVLLPIRRGLYILGAEVREGPVVLPLVANRLYGPSYVSLEYALSHHGLIPEGVFDVTSVTFRRSRTVTTPLGRFSYLHLPQPAYGIGIRMEQGAGGVSFLLASPEKALCDLLMLTRRLPLLSASAMRAWMLEQLRLDMEGLRAMDCRIILACVAAGYKARHLSMLAKVLESMP